MLERIVNRFFPSQLYFTYIILYCTLLIHLYYTVDTEQTRAARISRPQIVINRLLLRSIDMR